MEPDLGDRGFVEILPPDFGIVRPGQHNPQFFFDLQQPDRAHLQGRLIERSVLAFAGIMSVHILQVCDFLTQAAEVLHEICHLFEHTLILPTLTCFARVMGNGARWRLTTSVRPPLQVLGGWLANVAVPA
jgi:hypothetical protein